MFVPRSLQRLSSGILLLAIAGLSPAPALQAQGCVIGDDGLASVPCCAPVTALNLPAFPGFQLSGRYGCLKDCDLEADLPIRVNTTHIPILCDIAFLNVTVIPASATAPGYSGFLLAKYSRTWTEPDPSGINRRQVWRFLINGDLTINAGASPCPVPPYPASLPTVHFHGHIDYACEVDAAGNQVFRMAMSLHHLNGCIEHSFFSANPLTGAAAHNDRSYHIVAPGNFAFAPVPVPVGPVVAESMRSTNLLPTYQCLGESRIVQGQIVPFNNDWLCAPVAGGGPFSYTHYDHSATAVCGPIASMYQGIPIPPLIPLPPLTRGNVALPIGRWFGPTGVFPEQRSLVAHWGVMSYQDPCNPADPPFHWVHGVSTSGHQGFPFSAPAGALYTTWLDLQNMLNLNVLAAGSPNPPWGALFVSKVVWNVNLP